MKEPVRCMLFEENGSQYKTHKFSMEYLDGTPATEEEIDIGQNPWAYKWPSQKNHFTWSLLSQTPDIPTKLAQVRVFQTAFNTFEKIIPKRLDYIKQMDGDFRVEILTDLAVFNNRPGVLAQAYLFAPNSSYNGLIQFNDSPESNHYFTPLGWQVPAYLVDLVHYSKGQKDTNGKLITLASQPLLEIGMHEIKHGLGFRHNLNEPSSLMYPYVKPGWVGTLPHGHVIKSSFIWTDSDIQRLVDGYDRRWLPIHHLNRWRSRRVNSKIYTRYYN